ncbi:MAG TPA: SDR family NAD(P)-dependent oxidoreductase [Paucimonas sp.]|nr:SDR family NAD(P)-dependent oxidoreductase [Paucimonas sp.]
MKLAIVSGGSKGLGAALCAQYRARGFDVVEFSRSAPHAFSVRVDFSAPESVAPAVDAALKPLAAREWDEIVAVNNAAVLGPIGPAARKDPADILAHLNTNVVSGILFAARAVAAFQRHACRKTLVNVSSGAAAKGYDGWSLYCASKAALEQFIRSVAAEQAREPHPFTAINLLPGHVDTAMQASIRATDPHEFPDVGRFVGLRDAGALRSPEMVAATLMRIVELPDLQGGAGYSVADYVDRP